jgi:hypothetical protein
MKGTIYGNRLSRGTQAKKSLGTTGTNGAGSKIIFCGVQLNTHISY